MWNIMSIGLRICYWIAIFKHVPERRDMICKVNDDLVRNTTRYPKRAVRMAVEVSSTSKKESSYNWETSQINCCLCHYREATLPRISYGNCSNEAKKIISNVSKVCNESPKKYTEMDMGSKTMAANRFKHPQKFCSCVIMHKKTHLVVPQIGERHKTPQSIGFQVKLQNVLHINFETTNGEI